MLRALAFLLCASPALACDRPVCLATPGAVSLNRVVTFDDMPSGYGTGTRLDTLLLADGVGFGERFAGQDLGETADHDTLAGAVLSPLTLLPGEPGGNLGIMRLMGTNILLGHGPRLHPADNAVGEGAIAVLFDTDQAALGFDLRGGEDGLAEITFFNRQGTVIDRIRLAPWPRTCSCSTAPGCRPTSPASPSSTPTRRASRWTICAMPTCRRWAELARPHLPA